MPKFIWYEINKIHMFTALYSARWNFHVCYRSVLIFLKGISSKCFITVGMIRILNLPSVLCFVQSWFWTKIITTYYFARNSTLLLMSFLTIAQYSWLSWKLLYLKLENKNMWTAYTHYICMCIQAKRWLMAKFEVQLFVYLEEKRSHQEPVF